MAAKDNKVRLSDGDYDYLITLARMHGGITVTAALKIVLADHRLRSGVPKLYPIPCVSHTDTR